MYQFLTIGSALIDIYIQSSKFQPAQYQQEKLCLLFGDKAEVESLYVCSGGGATNTAVGFSRLGFRTAIVSETGKDQFGDIVISRLIRENVDTSLLINERKEQTGGSVILVGNHGERIVLVYRGASSMLDPFDISPYWLSRSNWIHLSSIAGRIDTLFKIFQIVKKSGKIRLSWNPGKAELGLINSKQLPVSSICADILFLNSQEWELVKEYHSHLLNQIPQIVITQGSKGADIYLQGKHDFHQDSLGIRPIDTTGAGDAFACAYSAATYLGKNPKTACLWGINNAASVLGYYGGKIGLLTRNDMERMIKKNSNS